MKNYTTPNFEFIKMLSADVITTSGTIVQKVTRSATGSGDTWDLDMEDGSI